MKRILLFSLLLCCCLSSANVVADQESAAQAKEAAEWNQIYAECAKDNWLAAVSSSAYWEAVYSGKSQSHLTWGEDKTIEEALVSVPGYETAAASWGAEATDFLADGDIALAVGNGYYAQQEWDLAESAYDQASGCYSDYPEGAIHHGG